MKQKITHNQLLRYLYNETSPVESLSIKEALNEDWELLQEYKAMKESFSAMPQVKFNPPDHLIQNVLNYSKENTVNAFS